MRIGIGIEVGRYELLGTLGDWEIGRRRNGASIIIHRVFAVWTYIPSTVPHRLTSKQAKEKKWAI